VGNLGDLAVATVSPLARFPVVLVVLHLGALYGVLVVAEGVFETALTALAQAVKTQCDEDEDPGGGGSDVDTDVGARAQIVPFLGEGLGWVVDAVENGGISPIGWLVVFMRNRGNETYSAALMLSQEPERSP